MATSRKKACKDQQSMTDESSVSLTRCQVCEALLQSKSKKIASTQTDKVNFTSLSNYISLRSKPSQARKPPSIQAIEWNCARVESYDHAKVKWMFSQNDSCARCKDIHPHVRLLRVLKKNIAECGIAQFDRNYLTVQGVVHSNTIWNAIGSEFQRDFTQLFKMLIVLDWIPLNSLLKQKLAPLSDSLRHIASYFPIESNQKENLHFFSSYVSPHDSIIVLNAMSSLLISLIDIILLRHYIYLFPKYFCNEMVEVKKKAHDILVFLNCKLQEKKISTNSLPQMLLPRQFPGLSPSTISRDEQKIEVCCSNQPLGEKDVVHSSTSTPACNTPPGSSLDICTPDTGICNSQKSLLDNKTSKTHNTDEVLTSINHSYIPIESSACSIPKCSTAHVSSCQINKCASDVSCPSSNDMMGSNTKTTLKPKLHPIVPKPAPYQSPNMGSIHQHRTVNLLSSIHSVPGTHFSPVMPSPQRRAVHLPIATTVGATIPIFSLSHSVSRQSVTTENLARTLRPYASASTSPYCTKYQRVSSCFTTKNITGSMANSLTSAPVTTPLGTSLAKHTVSVNSSFEISNPSNLASTTVPSTGSMTCSSTCTSSPVLIDCDTKLE